MVGETVRHPEGAVAVGIDELLPVDGQKVTHAFTVAIGDWLRGHPARLRRPLCGVLGRGSGPLSAATPDGRTEGAARDPRSQPRRAEHEGPDPAAIGP